MSIDESLAKGLVKRQHRELSNQFEKMKLSTKNKRAAAFRENVRELRRAFKGAVILEMIEGPKNNASAQWFVLVPSDHGQFSVELVSLYLKKPKPIGMCMLILSQHAVQRFQQKGADLLIELKNTVMGLIELILENCKSEEMDIALTKFIGENELEIYTETGRIPLVLSDEGILFAPTWIADAWSSPAKQKILKEERDSGALFVGKRIKEMADTQNEL